MFPLTATYYDPKERIWSGPSKKDIYSKEITLGEVAWLELSKNPQKVIQIHDVTKEQVTAQEFKDHIWALSKNFLKLGLKVDDVIGLYAHNSTHAATVMVASFLCGTPVNALFPGFDKENVKLVYNITTPKILFCDVENYEVTRQVSEELKLNAPIYVMNGKIDGVPSVLDLLKWDRKVINEPFSFPCTNLNGDDTAVILCSSGTTGTPKGVLCSHRALLHEDIYLTLKSDSVVCTFSTMYWASGLWNLTSALRKNCLRIITDMPYTPDYLLDLVERHKITHMILNATQIAEMSLYEDIAKMQKCVASIDSFLIGGSKVALIAQQKIVEIMSVNDKRPGIGVAYGMSELSGMLSFNCGYVGERKLGCEGKLVANKKVRIIGKRGEFLGPNEHGEIIISTPYKWFGYYRNEEATKKALKDDWLYTGDIGFFDDDGFLHVCARDNEVFKYRNFQIYPTLIEDVVLQLPGVFEACVVGIPDFVATNLAACAVVRKQDDTGRKLTDKDVIAYVQSKLGNMYHLHGGVYFVDALPKTGSGKPQRAKALKIIEEQLKKK